MSFSSWLFHLDLVCLGFWNRLKTWNEFKQIRDGASIDVPSAPTFAKMEVETQTIGGNEKVLVEVQPIGGSVNVVANFQPTIEVEET